MAKESSNNIFTAVSGASDPSFLVTTQYSIITGNTKASDVEQTAPIKLINKPKFGTSKATENVTITITVRKIISLVSGYSSARSKRFLIDVIMISIGIKNWIA